MNKKKFILSISVFTIFCSMLLEPVLVRAATTNPCDAPFSTGATTQANAGDLWYQAKTIEPIIPEEFRGYTSGTTKVYVDPTTNPDYATRVCTPAYWNMTQVKYFIFKAIHILNWVALALAIILIVYSGVLYISGFAVEANVKKAKSTVIATLTGLVIVFAARYIIDGAFILFSDDSANKAVRNPAAVPMMNK